MAETGSETAATVETTGEAAGHADEALLLGMGAEGWVSVSMFIFFALAIIIGKLPQRIAAALDARISAVKRQLDKPRPSAPMPKHC